MQNHLPEYVINTKLFRAIQKNATNYVKDTIEKHPCLLNDLFYLEKNDSREMIGLFDETLKPPLVLLLTPYAYAAMINRRKVLKVLVSLGADAYKSCRLIDIIGFSIEDAKNYKVYHFPPIGLCYPSDKGFSSAISEGYDVYREIIFKCQSYKDNIEVESTTLCFDGFWDFALSISKMMQIPEYLIAMTDCIVENGYDANRLLRQLDLEKLFKRYFDGCRNFELFPNAESASLAAEFVETLLQNGCDLTIESNAMEVWKTITQLVDFQSHSEQSRRYLIQLLDTALTLTPDLKVVENLRDKMIVKTMLNAKDYNTLLARCIRSTRKLVGSKFFFKKVNMLGCKDSVKRLLITARDA